MGSGRYLEGRCYDYSNERARQLAKEYCRESAVNLYHYLFHKRDDEESLQYRKGRRDYAQIELQFTGVMDSSISLHEPNDNVDYEHAIHIFGMLDSGMSRRI